MEDKVNKILEILISGLEKGTQVANEQLPLLLNEYVNYYIIEELPIISFFMFITCILSCFMFKERHEYYKKKLDEPNITNSDNRTYRDAMDATGATSIAFLIGSVVFLGFVLSSIKETSKVYFTPKAYIIEKIRE